MKLTRKLKKWTAAAVSVCLAAMELPLTPAAASAADLPEVPDFSYIGAVGTLTAEESAKAAEATYLAIANHQEAVFYGDSGLDMTMENKDYFIAIYRYILCGTEVGIGAKDVGVTWSPMSDSILINYRFDDSEYEAKYAEYKAMLDEIAAPVKPSWSDEEKALYFHEYIASNFDYDYPSYYGQVERPNGEQYSAYGMLANGMAVCEGYANLYSMLLNKVGVHTKLVTSKSLGHAWNAVMADGDWYYVDVTWDDLNYGYKGYVEHYNFLVTGDELVNSHTPHDSADWVDSFKNDVYSAAVPATFSDAFWRGTEKPIQRYQNKWLALTGTGVDVQFTLYDYDGATHKAASSPLTENLDYALSEWDVPGKDGYVWGDSYNIPVVVNDILYFSTPKAVYSYHNGKYIELHRITSAEEASVRIYSLYSKGGKLWYGLDPKRRNLNEVLETPVDHYPLDLSTLEAKVIAEAGAPTVKENTWTSPLKIADWKVGETPSVPTAAAKYGEPVFSYYSAADDTLLAGAPTAAGSYYVIAKVAGTAEYEELVSAPVSFKVTDTAITITVPDATVIYKEPAYFDIQVSGDLSDADREAIKNAVKVTCYGDTVYSPTDVGTYPITVDFDESLYSDRTFRYELGTLTVTKRTPFLTINGAESFVRLHYRGEPATDWGNSYLFTNNVDADAVRSYKWYRKENDGTYTELTEAPIHCGEYKAVVEQSESKNYTAQTLEVPVYIVPAELTAEFEDADITYGEDFSGKVKVRYTGLADADKELFPEEVAASTAYTDGAAAGEYELGGVLPDTSDYTVTVKNGTLTVKKKPLKVTAESGAMTYGEKPPTKVRVTYDGLTAADEAAFMDEFDV
ncbi:MAG: transglutaminase domain-containing protein, partial [Ruminococcus sp.]|nr:transglutaminase domain-containing protein [Ruminococcus sp.]